MLLLCTNRGCLMNNESKLNVKTGEVICSECGGVITGLSQFMIKQLKSMGQVIKNNEKKAFMVACPSCHANREVVLDEKGGTVCKQCGATIRLTASFKLAMEAAGMKLERRVVVAEEGASKVRPKIKTKKADKVVVAVENEVIEPVKE